MTWVPCLCCENPWCSVHDQHAFECPCPPVGGESGLVGIEHGEIEIDVALIAQALRIPVSALIPRLDGRVLGHLVEPVVASRVLCGGLAKRGSPFDAYDLQGRHWEIRVLTDSVSFAPSVCRGAGRKFDEHTFKRKLDLLYGFAIVDVKLQDCGMFPDSEAMQCAVWTIPASMIEAWWGVGILNADASISRKRFLVATDPENL